MPLPTLTNQADKDEILQRLGKISSASPRRWGKMTAPQMVCHLADSFRGVMAEKPLSRAPGPLPRSLMKWIGLYVPLPWPKGIKTRPEMDAQLQGTRPGEFEADVQELRRLLERFARQPREFSRRPHPIFDHMSDWEWARWGYLHVDHHLRQFGHRRMFRLAEDGGGAAQGTAPRSLQSGLDLYLRLRGLQLGAHAQPGGHSSGDVSRGRGVSGGALHQAERPGKIRNQLARTPLAMKNGKQNAASVNFSATC